MVLKSLPSPSGAAEARHGSSLGRHWAEEVRGWPAPPGSPARAPRLLLVDDEPGTDDEYGLPLATAGNTVLRVRSGEQALALLDRESCDLLLLEARLPGISGFQTCRQIWLESDVPIVFLTEQSTLQERLMAFDLGADDYIVRPTAVEEVARRVRAVLRRLRPAVGREVVAGPAGVTIDLRSHELRVSDAVIAATPKEFGLLRLLLERRGEVLTSDEISSLIWGYETFGSRNFVEAHISRLRAKLAPFGAGHIIATVRGVGYVVR